MSTDLVPIADEAMWHLWRSNGIGGSDIAALLGLSNYASPVSLYYEKVGVTDPHPESQRQRIGKRMEQVLAAEFHDMTGLHAVGEQTWMQHPEYEWARCTVDGFVADGPHLLGGAEFAPHGVVEYKTDGRFSWHDGVPNNIRAQVVWQMGVTGLHHAWVVVMFAGFKVEVFEVPWDDDAAADWKFMLEVADTFWHQHVVAGVVPPMDEHDATTRALAEVYADPDPDTLLDATDAARELVARVRAAQITTKYAEATETRVKNELRAYLGDHTDLIDGWIEPGPRSKKPPKPNVLASWRKQLTSSLDRDGLRAEAPELVAKHTTTTDTRVLRVSKLKEN